MFMNRILRYASKGVNCPTNLGGSRGDRHFSRQLLRLPSTTVVASLDTGLETMHEIDLQHFAELKLAKNDEIPWV